MKTSCIRTLLFILLAAVMTSCATKREINRPVSIKNNPKREFRGAWIQTAFQSEYSKMSPDAMKKDFIRKLNYLQDCGINAIIFQVRPEADAFYYSEIEPWSRFFTGEQGRAPEGNFDPMAFLIKECHKRNMEFHAWLNPFRASTSGNTKFAESHIYNKHPEWFVTYNKQILFDPGIPDCRAFICRVVRDIVSRYDVDAIHMDDYFYPYPVAGMPFPDDKSFAEYGIPKGYSQAQRDNWRRNNVNLLISDLKRTILLAKPWVRFGISPFGIYRNKKSTKDGSGSETNGLQNFDDLYADILYWVKQGWIDYNMPQIYWEIDHPAADYITLIKWWNKNANGRPLYIGQDVARTMKAKQLNKGIDQLMDEGVAQLFVNQFNGRKIIGTVGQLQFEVIQYRLENEYNARCRWEPLNLYKACWIESDDEAELEAFKKRKYQFMARDREGRDVFLADSSYVLQMAQNDFKHIRFHFTSEF